MATDPTATRADPPDERDGGHSAIEAQLRTREQQLAMVFNSARDMMLFAQVEPGVVFRVVSVNRRYLETVRAAGFKVSAQDFEGRTFAEAVAVFGFAPATVAEIRARYEQVIRTRQLLEYDEVTRTAGGVFYGRSTITPILDGAGNCGYLLYSSLDFTDRRRAEEALRESEEKFGTAFRASPDAISVHDMASGRYVDANPGVLRFFGCTREEIIGRSPTELGFWVELEERNAFIECLQRDRSVRDFVARFRLRSGEIRQAALSAEWVEIGGRPHNVTVLRDLTARLLAEQALRESEEKFATAFRVSPDIMSITEFDDGRYIEVNEAHERLFGFSRAESIGRSPLELGILRTEAVRDEMVRRLLEENGHLRDFKVEAWNRQGSPLTLQLSAEVIQFGGRKCILRNSHDITAAVKAEQALRESEAKFAVAFRSSPYSLTISELATGRYVDVNDGFEKLSGYTRAEVLGRTSTELGLWVNAADRDELVRRLRGNIEVRSLETEFIGRGGRRVQARCSCEAIDLDGTPCILTVLEDITSQRDAERDRTRLEAQLRQSQKLEALGTLAGGIAHDFNNILSAMIVYRELAVMDINRPAALRQHLAEIGAASNRAKELVRQILTFSRQQQQERSAVQLHPVVREALQLLRASLPTTIEIVPVIDEQTPQVLANTSQVHQVMMNLGTNAAHAMRDRPGRLTVTLRSRQLDEAQAGAHPGLRSGAYVQLSVADTGRGMDEATLARIFEPFFTTKGPGEGTGLGLSVVHGIMEDHDGAVLAHSRPGLGTTFDLYFPHYAGAASAVLDRDESTPRGAGESVLLIDDESPLCEAMRATLQKLGYRVTACTNPVDAVARFRAAPLGFDVVVTDHTMPRMTGLDVIHELHGVRPDLPALLVSGLSGTWTPDKLRGFSIRELVAKPVDFASLAQAVRRALDLRVTPPS